MDSTNTVGLPADRFGNLEVDPLLTQDVSLRLTAQSPVLNSGSTNGAPSFDYEGELRDLWPDIGCDEFRGTMPPDQQDADGDGLPDGWEFQFGLDPLQADAGEDPDLDGLANLAEFHYGTDPKKVDTDGDGANDDCEILAKSDPKDPGSLPERALQIATAVEVTVPTIRGTNYQLQTSAGLNQWVDLGLPLAGDGRVHRWYFPASENPGRFYRVKPE